MPRRASRPSAFPAPPRLPPTHVLRRLDAAVLEDEAGYTDVDIVTPVQGRAAKKVTIERATLRDLDLTATRLDTLKLSDVRLVSCDLANAVWREATLTRVELLQVRHDQARALRALRPLRGRFPGRDARRHAAARM